MKALNSLDELFMEELKDIYNAEQQLVKALPKMAKEAGYTELEEAILEHLEETKQQVQRLEQVFQSLGQKARGAKCEAMEGLIAEGKEVLETEGEPAVLDAAIIAAAQKVEHYEIATYGTLVAWARLLGHDDAAELLEESLEEEKAADEKLTEIAESIINHAANETDSEDDEDSEEEDESTDDDDEEMSEEDDEMTGDEEDEETAYAPTGGRKQR